MNKTTESVQLFSSGFNCAQSVLSTYGKDFFKQPGDALKLASAFGAGVTYRGEMCGAVSGALMVIGLKYGYNEMNSDPTKQKCLQISREFLAEFEKRHGSIVCKKLLTVDVSSAEGLAYAREKGLFEDICPKLVFSAGEIIELLDTKYTD